MVNFSFDTSLYNTQHTYKHYTQKLYSLSPPSLHPALPLSILTAIFHFLGLASFIGAKDDGRGGDSCSYNTYKAPVKSSPTNKPTPNFLQARCPSGRSTNSVKALKVKEIVHCEPKNTPRNLRFSIKISVYLGNGTRQDRGYYGSPIGSHRLPIYLCQFL